jgi:hypothetical protein
METNILIKKKGIILEMLFFNGVEIIIFLQDIILLLCG